MLEVLRCYMQHGLSVVPVSITQKVIEGLDENSAFSGLCRSIQADAPLAVGATPATTSQ